MARAAFVGNSHKYLCNSDLDLCSIPLHVPRPESISGSRSGSTAPHWFENDRTLWIRSILADTWLPATIRPEQRPPIERVLLNGDAEGLSPYLSHFLYYAGSFGPAHRDEDVDRTAREKFAACGYANLNQLLPPAHIAALRRYYRALRSRNLMVEDRKTPGRKFIHNDLVARSYHHALTPLMARFVGQAIKPSYVFVGTYERGAQLRLHTDRPPCQYTVSMQVDFNPEPNDSCPWPLQIQAGDEDIKIYQKLGEAFLFRGTELAHCRETLGCAETSTSMLFHYVDADYQGQLD